MSHPRLTPQRLFFLGAGFSAAAGLPLAQGLLRRTLDEIELFQPDSHLHTAVDEYREFVEASGGLPCSVDEVDIEQFAEYLDHEHFLGLLGSDTFSEEGNRAQLLLRWGIGRVIHTATPAEIPQIYLDFAERLRGGDIVATFNYDMVLERALDTVGLLYRRVPHRFAAVDQFAGTLDIDRELAEVAVLKLHGSIDWLNRGRYLELRDSMRARQGDAGIEHIERTDLIFGTALRVRTRPLVEGLYPADALRDIYVVDSLDEYYSDYGYAFRYPPVILAPSRAKQLYGLRLRSFWEGLPLGGAMWGGFSIVGCSLPPADPYTQQALYRIGLEYGYGREHPDERMWPMSRIKVVNRASGDAADELRGRYRFLPADHTDFLLEGLDHAAVESLFEDGD